jgi:O-antigen biosynthesis protein
MRVAPWLRPKWHRAPTHVPLPLPDGISIVIPSRNGRQLLEQQFPTLLPQRAGTATEILVVDNGSDDGTAEWLAARHPEVRAIVSRSPLSFARAVNRGIAEARYSHICLLNNDMLLEPGFFGALRDPFRRVPDLFCATAQIRFPAGVRREETGKAVMAHSSPDDFPLRCDEPLPGEDGTWVLYGSGGCSLYDTDKLRALGSIDEAYEPAYVEDLDIGWRGWQQGWPSVYVAGAVVEHRHRATTSRYYSEAELERVLEINYLRFLVRGVDSGRLFRQLWREAMDRYRRTGRGPSEAEAESLIWEGGRLTKVLLPEEEVVALTDGSTAIFPGGGTDVLLWTAEAPATPAEELRGRYAAVIAVREANAAIAAALARRRWPRAALWTASPLSMAPIPWPSAS